MKKAAIITWCNEGINYGQVLQAYAMQRIARKYNLDSVTIRYRKPKSEEHMTGLKFPVFKKCYEWYLGLEKAGAQSRKVKLKFNRFVRKNIVLSAPCYSKEDVEQEVNKNKCNILICGSDQIWNPVAFDPIYYLDFCGREMLRIAYAPSIAEDELNSGNRHIFEKMRTLIDRLDFVSVREEAGANILRQIMDKPVTAVLDPTFLLSRKGWDHIAAKPLYHGDYIFCYVLGDIKLHRENLRRISEKYRTSKVIYLRTTNSMLSSREEFRDDIGPEEFVSLIKNAKAVYTDSFHGVALSINYGREFYTCRRYDTNAYNKNSRISNILDIFDLQSRYIEKSEQMIDNDRIDYEVVNQILRRERMRAFQFLGNAFR